MHNTIQNLLYIKDLVKSKIKDLNINKTPRIIAVSKTFDIEKILPLIEYGHIDFGENKVQEATEKWKNIKIERENIKLHLIGKLQTNKVKFAVKIFDFIHSLDSKKLAVKIAEEQIKQNKRLKLFIQVNIGNEEQKSGVDIKDVKNFYDYCKNLKLNIIGIMCIPPQKFYRENYYADMNKINKKLNLFDLSMGMSDDYLKAVEFNSTYLRIGSKIFGQRR